MTRTLLVGDRPFSCLRGRAAMAALDLRRRRQAGTRAPILVQSEAGRLMDGFEPVPTATDPATLGIGHVLVAGIFRRRVALEVALATAAPLVAAGATLEAACLTLEGSAATPVPPRGAELLDAAVAIEARDHHTADVLLLWRVAAQLRIDAYPDRAGSEDPALSAGLPEGPLLGLAMVGGPEAERLRAPHLDLLRERLAPFRGWPVLPLPVETPGRPEDDLPATLDLAAALLPGSPVLLPELRDAAWRRREWRLARLRALVGRCTAIVASQDLPAAIAVAKGIPVLGLAFGLGPERRIVSCMAALANDLPAGSDLLWLGVPRYASRR